MKRLLRLRRDACDRERPGHTGQSKASTNCKVRDFSLLAPLLSLGEIGDLGDLGDRGTDGFRRIV